MAWLEGKKTYLIAFVAAALAFVDAMGWTGHIPPYVYAVLTALGLTTGRIGAKKDAGL